MLFKVLASLSTSLALLASTGCKSSDKSPEPASEVKSDAGAPASADAAAPAGADASPSAASLDTALDLNAETSQNLYLMMLSVELNAGVNVPKDQVHSVNGIVECKKDGVLETCSARVRLPGEELSGGQPVAPKTQEAVRTFVKTARADLANTPLVLADLNCDYVGKKSPPYNLEEVRCQVSLVRAPSEAVFEGRVAEELGELVRGETAFGNGVVSVSGALACRTVDGSSRQVCLVRSAAGSVLQEAVAEVSGPNAALVAKRLVRAAMDRAAFAKNADTKNLRAPKEVVGALQCSVDSAKLEEEGRRRYVCRASL